MIVIVMGVVGAGKTTVGSVMAQEVISPTTKFWPARLAIWKSRRTQ